MKTWTGKSLLLRRAFKLGADTKTAALAANCSLNYAHAVRKRLGVALPPSDAALAVESLALSGRTMRQIGEETGRTKACVYHHLKRLKLKAKPSRVIDPVKLAQMDAEGYKTGAIAQYFGCSKDQVYMVRNYRKRLAAKETARAAEAFKDDYAAWMEE